jgi:hypothetical protein
MQVSPNVDQQVAAIQLTARVAEDLAPADLLPSLGAALQLLVRPPCPEKQMLKSRCTA